MSNGLRRYSAGFESWSESKLLGEHVGGSAVRSICSVSKIHVLSADMTNVPDGRKGQDFSEEGKEFPFLLISVGAKRVLTSWLLRNRKLSKTEHTLAGEQHNETGNRSLLETSSSMTFQWLSTDMPPKYSSSNKHAKNIGKLNGVAEDTSSIKADVETEEGKMQLKSYNRAKCEDDWRYLAVTAFLVKCAGSRWLELHNAFVLLIIFILSLMQNFMFFDSFQVDCLFCCCCLFRCHTSIPCSSFAP